MKKLFLAHYSGDAAEVRELALELRLHGIVPWVDKDGGFSIADECESEARRAIREDCFGLLLYATPEALTRRFIREVEVDEAAKARQADPSFALFAVPRGMGFDELAERSRGTLGVDLAAFHTLAIPEGADLRGCLPRIASETLDMMLARSGIDGTETFSLQFSTRELMPTRPEDALCIDAVGMLAGGIGDSARWDRLLRALGDVKAVVAARYGRPRLYVHGSKHLTAAFVFGRVFAPFDMDIRQTSTAVWRTDVRPLSGEAFGVTLKQTQPDGGQLFVEVASGNKNIAQGVDALIAMGGPTPSLRLQLRPRYGALAVDNSLCRAMAEQTYAAIERVAQAHRVDEIHLFAAAHQSFMMMLGRSFRGMPDTHLYEWSEGGYVRSCSVPGGVL